jgi:hypothetical protein
MSNQPSEIILLCEDRAHEGLTRAYLKKCGIKNLEHIFKARVVGGFSFVLDHFPNEFKACRHRHKSRANTLLIVLIDADQLSVDERRRQLLERAKSAGLDDFGEDEPTVVLIPKRHIETWLKSLLGENVNEDDDYKDRKKISKDNFRMAANTLHEWSLSAPKPESTCVPSLRRALPDWKKAGRRT